MKKFCISISFVLLLVFAGDRIAGVFLRDINRNYKSFAYDSHNIAKLNYLTSDISDDIVCIGSSLCQNNYVSAIIADSLNCSVYNAGWPGTVIPSHFYLLQQILAVHKPRIICLDIRHDDGLKIGKPFRRLLNYAPCFGKIPEADKIFRKSGNYAALSLSHIYRYNNHISAYLGAWLSDDTYTPDANRGYRPLKPSKTPIEDYKQTSLPAKDPLRIYYLEQFIELCRENDIKLLICITPKYSLMKREFYDIPKNIAERYGVPVFDYHDHQLFLGRPEYFKDNMHLCDAGARLFTSIFAHDLKEYLTNGKGQTPQHL